MLLQWKNIQINYLRKNLNKNGKEKETEKGKETAQE